MRRACRLATIFGGLARGHGPSLGGFRRLPRLPWQ
jgi:hypothetical protein